MPQSSSFIDKSLFLRDELGQNLPATPEQILEIAWRVVDLQVGEGMLFSSPTVMECDSKIFQTRTTSLKPVLSGFASGTPYSSVHKGCP